MPVATCAEPGQLCWSGAPCNWLPLVCGAVLTAVAVEEIEEFDVIEEDELDRCKGLRGANMPRMSSGSIAFMFCPPLPLHDCLFKSGKLGGFATAVMSAAMECFAELWGRLTCLVETMMMTCRQMQSLIKCLLWPLEPKKLARVS